MFSIPPRSPDLNPIENFFNLVTRQLHNDALDMCTTRETFEEFSERVKKTLENFPAPLIDKIITSLSGRLNKVIKRRGQRLDSKKQQCELTAQTKIAV